jgi:hypothetical protein
MILLYPNVGAYDSLLGDRIVDLFPSRFIHKIHCSLNKIKHCNKEIRRWL